MEKNNCLNFLLTVIIFMLLKTGFTLTSIKCRVMKDRVKKTNEAIGPTRFNKSEYFKNYISCCCSSEISMYMFDGPEESSACCVSMMIVLLAKMK